MITNKTVSPSVISEYLECGAEFFFMKTSEKTDHFFPHSLRYIGYE
jgi:hypothetical protein